MTKKPSYTDSEKDLQSKSAARRATIRKITSASVIVGSVAAMPNSWVKPIVQSVVLPAHAESSERCFPIAVSFTPNFDANGSNNIGAGIFEISSTAPFDLPVTINSVSVSTGTLSGFVPALPVGVSVLQMLLIDWVSLPGFLNSGIPTIDLGVSIAWTCADGKQGTLNRTVVNAGTQQQNQATTQETQDDSAPEQPADEPITEEPIEEPVTEEPTEAPVEEEPSAPTPDEDSSESDTDSPSPA